MTGWKGEQGATGRTGATGAKGRPGRDADRAASFKERVLPVAVVALALLMGGQYVYLLSGVSERAECESNVRATLASRSDDNQNRLILGVARMMARPESAKETPAQRARRSAEFRALFTAFTAEAGVISADRQALLDGEAC